MNLDFRLRLELFKLSNIHFLDSFFFPFWDVCFWISWERCGLYSINHVFIIKMCWEMKLVLMLRWMRTRELLFWTTSLPSYCFISLDTYKRVPITQKGFFIANILEWLHFLFASATCSYFGPKELKLIFKGFVVRGTHCIQPRNPLQKVITSLMGHKNC